MTSNVSSEEICASSVNLSVHFSVHFSVHLSGVSALPQATGEFMQMESLLITLCAVCAVIE